MTHYKIQVRGVGDTLAHEVILVERITEDKPDLQTLQDIVGVLDNVDFVENPSVTKAGPAKPQYVPKTPRERLGYLVEECGEVLQIAGKSLRYGYRGFNPELPECARVTNAELLRREIADLKVALSLIREDLHLFPEHPEDLRYDGEDLLDETRD